MSRPVSVENRRARRFWSAARIARATAVALALLGGGNALADESGKQEKPEEIVIQGKENRNVYNPDRLSLDRLKSVKKTQSVVVVPQILIEQQGATTLTDALRNVSGIGLNAGEGGVQGDDFTLRGYSAKTDIFIDGVRDQGSYKRDTFNQESIEVIKGPSSSYFGRGSTGGVINQVSKTARAGNSYAGIVSSGMGPFNRATFDVNQQLSESVAFRANVMGQSSELEGRDGAEVRRYGYGTSLVVGLDQPTQLTFNYLYQKDNNVPDYGLPYIGGEPARVDRESFFGSGAQRDFEKVTANVATMRFDHAFNDDVKLRNTTRYSHIDRAAAPTAPRECQALTNVPAANLAAMMGRPAITGLTAGCAREEVTPAGTPGADRRFNQLAGIRRGRPERDARETILSNQTDLTINFSTGGFEHSLSTGFEVAREDFRLTRFTNDGPSTLGLDDDSVATFSFGGTRTTPLTFVADRLRSQRRNTRALSTGVFVADELRLNDYVDLIAGLRYDRFAASFNDDFPLTSNPRLTGPDFDNVDRMLSYRAGIAFHPTPEQNYYISYGTSFNPSAESLALAANNQGTDPEENRTFEIGGKVDLRGGQLSLQGALFQIDKTDAREADLTGAVQVLSGERRVRGFELGVTGRVTDGWVLFGSYTFLDSEITSSLLDKNPNPNDDIEGNEVLRVPRHSGTLWSSYQFPGEKLEIGGGPTYVSHRFANDDNVNKVDGYVRWDAAIGYAVTEKVNIRLNIQNVTDKEYFENAGGGHAVPGPGRTAIATVSFNF
jgi:catecholate siderophore receptor